jgi:hypothetical protein
MLLVLLLLLLLLCHITCFNSNLVLICCSCVANVLLMRMSYYMFQFLWIPSLHLYSQLFRKFVIILLLLLCVEGPACAFPPCRGLWASTI